MQSTSLYTLLERMSQIIHFCHVYSNFQYFVKVLKTVFDPICKQVLDIHGSGNSAQFWYLIKYHSISTTRVTSMSRCRVPTPKMTHLHAILQNKLFFLQWIRQWNRIDQYQNRPCLISMKRLVITYILIILECKLISYNSLGHNKNRRYSTCMSHRHLRALQCELHLALSATRWPYFVLFFVNVSVFVLPNVSETYTFYFFCGLISYEI